MTNYVTRELADGSKIKYRKNPPRDNDGKVVPTQKQIKAREAASRKMANVARIMKLEYPDVKPFTKQYGKLVSDVMKRQVAHRAKVCRNGSKITRCKNVTK